MVCALCVSVAGCGHWYGRGAIAAGGGVVVGAGLGAVLPCSDTEPGCRGDTVTKMAVISGALWMATWAAVEVAMALKVKPSESSSSYEDYSTPSYDTTPTGASYSGDSGGSADGDCPCSITYSQCIEADVGDGSGRLQCELDFNECLNMHCGANIEKTDDVSGDGGTSGHVHVE